MYPLELTTPEDLYFDYCLWEYAPAARCENKLRSSSLLFHSFDVAGVQGRVFDLVRAIRRGFGLFHTVWGLKKLRDGATAWEFYFYDYRRRERERSITKLLDIIRPFAPCGVIPNENHPYFMFSIDIDDRLIAGTKGLDEVHMYIGNPGSSVSSGICYSLTERGKRLENLYFFFDAKREWEDILAKTACSAHIDSTRIPFDRILRPELRECRVIVAANKQAGDSVYFSRIRVDQFLFFLKEMSYPPELVSFVEENRPRLDHLLYDVGFDYTMDGEDLIILKSGYYGTF